MSLHYWEYTSVAPDTLLQGLGLTFHRKQPNLPLWKLVLGIKLSTLYVCMYVCSIYDFIQLLTVKVWADAILTVGSPECLTVRLTVRSQWAHCYHCMVGSSVDLMNSSQQAHGVSYKLTESSQQAHGVTCKLTESSQQAHSASHLVSSLWAGA